jgi:hypothetical protein
MSLDTAIMPKLRKGEKLLVKVDVGAMSKVDANKYMAEIYDQMKEKFQKNEVIVHTSDISFWVLPDASVELPTAKLLMTSDL